MASQDLFRKLELQTGARSDLETHTLGQMPVPQIHFLKIEEMILSDAKYFLFLWL